MTYNESYKLTYFNVKAVAEPIRLIFAYAGVKYEDNRIEHADWPEVKKNFPNGQLPVLQVGDKVLAQSNAICRFLARKYNLHGRTDFEAAKMDEIADSISDFRIDWTPVRLEQDQDKKAQLTKNFVDTNIPKYYGKLDSIIEKNEGSLYLVGKKISWVDLMLVHYLEMFDTLIPEFPNLLDSYPNLTNLRKTDTNLPQIKAWIEKRPKTAF